MFTTTLKKGLMAAAAMTVRLQQHHTLATLLPAQFRT